MTAFFRTEAREEDTKIFYLLKADPDETLEKIMELHRERHEVTEIDLRREKDYDKIAEMVPSSRQGDLLMPGAHPGAVANCPGSDRSLHGIIF